MWLKKVFCSSFLLVIGCGDQAHFVPDMAADLSQSDDRSPGISFPSRPATDHPALPILNNLHGPVIPNMKAYLVVWPGDLDVGEQAQQFMQWMLQSSYWTDSLGEYGIKSGAVEQLITLSSPAPSNLDDSMIQSQVAELVNDGKVVVDDNTVVFFITSTSSNVSFQGTFGCSDFGGYHFETVVGGSHLSYAVAVQCSNIGGGGDPFDPVTTALSHEASEAATDPRPASSPSWRNVDTGLEISDLCELFSARVTAQASSGNPSVQDVMYRVARNYSNRAALLGDEDPCKPVSSTAPYYGVALDPLTVAVGRDQNNDGQVVAQIQPYAFGEVGPISWQIFPTGGGITITPDHGTNNAGDTVGVLIKVDSSVPSSAELLYVVGRARAGSHSSWTGVLLY